jgi:rare lipoprotein A
MRSLPAARAVFLLASSLACSTPPPIARTPPEPNARKAPLSSATPAASAPSLQLASSSVAAPPVVARPTPRDTAAEHRELEQRFGRERALATLLGEASYYSDIFTGRKTASGEPYDPKRYTAAHRSLPFGTVLRVRRKDTGHVVYVRVNDRGPFGKKRRILDLSKAAAEHLGMLRRGIADVRIEIVERPKPKPKSKRKRRR